MNPNIGPLHIFTPCWGSEHLGLLDKALGQSLSWQSNNEALKSRNAKWTFVVDGSGSECREIAQRVLPGCQVTILTYPKVIEPNAPIGAIKMEGLLQVIEKCLDEKSQMLMATPDFIYGDGTIKNMLTIAERQDSCVGMAHIRVLPSFMEDMAPLSNLALMTRAFKHPHQTWVDSEIGKDPSACFYSGVSWRKLDAHNYAVTHRLISSFLVNFKSCDLHFFKKWKGVTAPAFGEWDHDFPEHLFKQDRLRIIGSSDIAAMAEITRPDKNCAPLMDFNLENFDAFKMDKYHTKIQMQFVNCFRGEENG